MTARCLAGRALSRVSPTARTPTVPAIVSAVIALAILLVNINKPQIFTVVTGVAIVLISTSPTCSSPSRYCASG